MTMFFLSAFFALFFVVALDGVSPEQNAPISHLVRLQGEKVLVDDSAAKWLETTSQELYVVSVHGAYHSGKSFFINQLLNLTDHRFPVGTTTDPTTKGMDMVVSKLSKESSRSIMFIDTEGMSATDTTLNHDAKLFTLSAVVADLIVFNTMGTIDTAALDLLEMLSRHARLMQLKAGGGSNFASLMFLVQNFLLNHVRGEDATQWLTRVLEQQGSGLADVFGGVTANTLAFPFALHEFNPVATKPTNKQYSEDLLKTKEAVVKLLSLRSPRSGKEILSLLRVACDAINSGKKTEEIPSIWQAFYQSQLTQARIAALESFSKHFPPSKFLMGGNGVPLSPIKLVEMVDEAYTEALQVFDQATFGLRNNDTGLRNDTILSIQDVALQTYNAGLDSIRRFVEDHSHFVVRKLEAKTTSDILLPLPSVQLKQKFDALSSFAMEEWALVSTTYSSKPISSLGQKPESSLALPLPPSAALQACEQAVVSETKFISQQVEFLYTKLSEENRKLLSKLAQQAEEGAVKNYIQSTVVPKECFTSAQLQSEEPTQASLTLFRRQMQVFNQEPDFEMRLNSVKYKLMQTKEMRIKENLECLKTKCGILAKQAIRRLDSDLHAIILPQADAKLQQAISASEKTMIAFYQSLAGDYILEPGCRIEDLKYKALIQRTLQQNVDAVATFFGLPLREAKREAEGMDVAFPYFSVRSQIREMGLQRIKQHRTMMAGNRVEFEELIGAAVDHWLDTDMDSFIQSKLQSLYLTVALGVVILILVVVVAWWVQRKWTKYRTSGVRSKEHWMSMSTNELRRIAQLRGIPLHNVFEKEEIVDLLLKRM